MSAQFVLDFWFSAENKPYWFKKSDAFDAQIDKHFAALWQQAAQGELVEWRESLPGRLAEIIVLDQFSRNLFRNDARAFAQDTMALVLAQEALRQPGFADMNEDERHFMLMPYMHSESRLIHEWAVPLFVQYTNDNVLAFEKKHKLIIDRFGRYPHRNALLGRESSAEERAFLQEPGSSF